MPNIPAAEDFRHQSLRSFVRREIRKVLESIKAGDREVLCDFDRMPSLDETDELVLITAGYQLADRLYAKATRR